MRRSVFSLVAIFSLATIAAIASPSDAYAQRVRVRAGIYVSSGPRIIRSYRPYRSYYYAPYYHDSFYWGLWGPYSWHPSVWHTQPPRYRRMYNEASLRVEVSPTQAEVYVDGYYVGIVDSFDGRFQRLDVPAGERVIEIFHEGHRSIRETMRFEPRATYHLKRAMEPLAAGDPAPLRPKPDPSARPQYAPDRQPRDRPYPPDRPADRPRQMREGESGAVAIRVQPAGAIILIDGEKWDGPDGPERLVVHLSEGSHKIEVQKEGYRTFTTEVRISRGETIPLNISLRTASAN